MALKTKKGLKGSIDDVLDDLLGDETTLPEKPVKRASRPRDNTGAAQTLPSARAGSRSLLEDDAFSTMAGPVGADAEVSDVSEADPQALLQDLKDLDDMDADLLGLKKSHPAASKSAAQGSGNEERPSNPKPASMFTVSAKDKEDAWGDEDFIFGAYQPTVGSSEGRQSRRQSVRFLAEGGPDLRGEPGSKQSTPVASSPTHPRKGGADWLGLKDEDLDLLLPPSPTREPRRGGTSSAPHPTSRLPGPGRHSAPAGLPSSSPGTKPLLEGADSPVEARQPSPRGASEEKEEEDWLSLTLSQKKSPGLAREERTVTSKGQSLVGAAGRLPSSSTQGLKQAAAGGTSGTAAQKPPARRATSGSPVTLNQATLALHAGDPKKDTAPGVFSSTEPVMCFPSSQEPTGLPVPAQTLLPESLGRNLLPGTEYQKQLLAAQVQLQTGTAELQAELLQNQARLADLEAQVRKLELERTQHKLLLESLQQRHQADLELIENAHRSRIKVLETSYQQREERLLRENEELSSQYLSHCQEAERAHAELTAQHQRRLAAATQEKDQEMERLRELQRASILEMRKDHEEQLQRLKLLKDREIDAVTSATSHTRSLNGVIEQMEQFSSSLSELSSRVEASHVTTAQEREQGIRRRDEQLRALQDRLDRQQRDMEEERSRFQEVMGKMEARLNEQSRLLEQERWRVSAEQSKVECTQRALEEQRKVMAQQMAMEREELERAKSALLEEQKSVMLKCGEERRRLAAEWAEFSAQQKLSKERAEREAERALKVDTQREGILVSLAKEQAELKIRASELRAKEDQLAAEREALERERQELRLEKERVSTAALRVRLREEEVDRLNQVASEKYEEGERALREARQVQSEQQARLQQVQKQQERLQQQEQHLHQENVSMAQQRLQLDRIRQDLPSSPVGLLNRAQGLAASRLSAIMTPASTNPACLGPSHLHTKLVLLKHMAEQDRDFLENEQFFLETLKKASYNMT